MIICYACEREMMTTDSTQMGVPVLILQANKKPYKLVYGDLRVCPNCGIAAWDGASAGKPTWHYEKKFQKELETAKKHPLYMEVK